MAKFVSSLKAKLIYVFRINDKAHAGCLKVGEATLSDEENYEDYKSFTIAQNAKASVTEDLNDSQAVITFNLCD